MFMLSLFIFRGLESGSLDSFWIEVRQARSFLRRNEFQLSLVTDQFSYLNCVCAKRRRVVLLHTFNFHIYKSGSASI